MLYLKSKIFLLLYFTGLLRKSKLFFFHYKLKEYIKKDWVVVDVGANIGYYTMLFQRWAKKVYAIEPYPKYLRTLYKNIADNVRVYPCGLDWEERTGTMQESKEFKTGGAYLTGGAGVEVDLKTGDNLLQHVPRIDFIKIDVEGYGQEILVLNGLLKTIQKHKPMMLIECDPRERYKIFDLLPDYESILGDSVDVLIKRKEYDR